jgi:uncharacterized protein
MQPIHFHAGRARAASTFPARYERSLRHADGNSMQIILKVTEVCNIACTYCYFFFGGDESHADNPAHIAVPTIDALARFLGDAVASYGIRRITLIIHGGEPLMLKRERMDYLLSAVAAHTAGATLRVTLQTNGMLIDEAWIALFERHQVYVGVSLDGPEAIHDRARIDKKGEGTYARTVQGVRMLVDASAAGRIAPPGLLCVLQPDVPAELLYRHFVDELGFRNIDFLLPIQNHDTFDPTQSAALAQSMRTLFALYRAETKRNINIRFFNKVLYALTMAPFFHATLYRYIAQKDIVLVVSSAGDIGPDDNLRTSDPALMRLDLNVARSTLRDVLLNEKLGRLIQESFRIPRACQDCDVVQACRGGDLFHRYRAANGFDNRSIHCETLYAAYTDMLSTLIANGSATAQLEARLAAVEVPEAEHG